MKRAILGFAVVAEIILLAWVWREQVRFRDAGDTIRLAEQTTITVDGQPKTYGAGTYRLTPSGMVQVTWRTQYGWLLLLLPVLVAAPVMLRRKQPAEKNSAVTTTAIANAPAQFDHTTEEDPAAAEELRRMLENYVKGNMIVVEMPGWYDTAAKRLSRGGTNASAQLAELIRELAACRSKHVETAVWVAAAAKPTPDLLLAIKDVVAAPGITNRPTNMAYPSEIQGADTIGWTDGTERNIKKQATYTLNQLSGTPSSA